MRRKTQERGYLSHFSRRLSAAAFAAAVVVGCAKTEPVSPARQEEQRVLNQSVFHPGELAPEVNVLAAVGGETGTVDNPNGGGGSGTDGGVITGPGGSTGGSDGGTVGGGDAGGDTGGSTGGGSTGGDSAGGGSTGSGDTAGGSTGGDSGAGSDGGDVAGGGSTGGTGSDGGTVPGGDSGGSTGTDGGTVGGGDTSGGGTDGGTAGGGSTGGGDTAGGGSTGGGDTAGGGSTGGGDTAGGDSGSGDSGGSTGGGDVADNDGGSTGGGDSGGSTGGSDGGTVGGGDNTGGGSDGGTVGGGDNTGGGSDGGDVADNDGNDGNDDGGSTGGGSDGGDVADNDGGSGGNDGGNTGGDTGGGDNDGGSTGGGDDTGGGNDGGDVADNDGDNGGDDGGTVGGGDDDGGDDDGGGIDGCVARSHGGKGNNGVGNGYDPQPPGNPPVNDGYGTGPGNPGNRKRGRITDMADYAGRDMVCKKEEIEVKFSRICSQYRSQIPYPQFVFYEELRNPILSLEAAVPVKGRAPQEDRFSLPQLAMPWFYSTASRKMSTSRGSSLVNFLVQKVDLAGIDLFAGRWQGNIAFSLDRLKEQYPKEWKKAAVSAWVCDDRDGDGFCSPEGYPWVVSVNRPTFTAGNTPRSVQVDVWHGRHMLIKTDREFCEQQYSPIVMDLAGNGIRLVGPESGVEFDLNDTGEAVYTGWPGGKDDAFLVRDLDGNGRIDSGAELFGSATRLESGQRAPNGFAALAEHDDNGDGQIDRKDAIWRELRLWIDADMNGRTGRNEMVRLERLQVESINLAYVDMMEVDPHGNETRMRSTFRRRVGGRSVPQVMVDVWFNTLNRIDEWPVVAGQ